MILKTDRFDIKGQNTTMKAIVTNGNGGYEQLEYRDVPIPELSASIAFQDDDGKIATTDTVKETPKR